MTDDEYNQLFGVPPPNYLRLWIIAVTIFIIVGFALVANAEECEYRCTGSRFVLHIDGVPVETGNDMTEEECTALAEQADMQTEAFTVLECVEEAIARIEL